MHHVEIYAIHDLPPLSFLRHKSGFDKGLEMIGKRRRWHSQMLSNLTDVQTIFPGSHQQSKNR